MVGRTFYMTDIYNDIMTNAKSIHKSLESQLEKLNSSRKRVLAFAKPARHRLHSKSSSLVEEASRVRQLKNSTEVSANRSGLSSWVCTCGAANSGKFCGVCGGEKPQNKNLQSVESNRGIFIHNRNTAEKIKQRINSISGIQVTKISADSWQCVCDTVNTGNFCSSCGKRR